MIKFFRKVRQRLLSEGKTGKYLKYAIGEIILVVIGIVIALQLNNWNESRKNEDEFKAVLQQIFTVVDQDSDNLKLTRYQLSQQIKIIDDLVQHADEIDKELLPHLLYYLDTEPSGTNSEISYLIGYLKFNPHNKKQSNLNKSLSSYGSTINEGFNYNRKIILPFLEKSNIPYPSIVFGYSAINDFENMDSNFFSETDIDKAFELIKNPVFLNALKSVKSIKSTHLIFIDDLIAIANTNKTFIQDYYPNVKLLYSDIGLIGDATPHNNWSTNLPLTLTNELEAIWEGDFNLTKGSVKFREGENWNFNWGGDTFPNGNTLSFGNNIQVKPGNYHVILNLDKKTYQFIEQNE
ncbi:DUF6090 family protein [Flagellimonas lutimaris]|uniref:DUF6090 family protein n=1 Tax=Flagellimonas lutimaris TaxID=475082 RepID=UPI003F5CF530